MFFGFHLTQQGRHEPLLGLNTTNIGAVTEPVA